MATLQLNRKPNLRPGPQQTQQPPSRPHPLQSRVVYRSPRTSLPAAEEPEEEEKAEIWLSSSLASEPHYEPVKGTEVEGIDSPSVFSHRASVDLTSADGEGGTSGMGRKKALARVSVASIASQLSNFSSRLGMMGGQRKSVDFEDDSMELMSGLERDSSSEGHKYYLYI